MSDELSRSAPPDGAIDRAIDRAVRTMMQVDPPAGLRRRVLARLDAPRPRVSLFPQLAIGMAAVAVLVLAVVLFRPTSEPVAPPAERAEITPPAAVPAPTVSTVAPPAVRAPAPATASRTARRGPTDTLIPMPRIGNVFGAREPRVAATAAEIEDVVFPEGPAGAPPEDVPGMPRAIGIPQITITPLQIERIRVEPMPARK